MDIRGFIEWFSALTGYDSTVFAGISDYLTPAARYDCLIDVRRRYSLRITFIDEVQQSLEKVGLGYVVPIIIPAFETEMISLLRPVVEYSLLYNIAITSTVYCPRRPPPATVT